MFLNANNPNYAAGKIPIMITVVAWFTVTSALKLQNNLKRALFLFNLYIGGPYNVIKIIIHSLLRMTINATAHHETLRSSHEKIQTQPTQLNGGNFYIHSKLSVYIFVFNVLQLIVCRQFSVI